MKWEMNLKGADGKDGELGPDLFPLTDKLRPLDGWWIGRGMDHTPNAPEMAFIHPFPK